jgi:hypothetical protein
MPGPVPLILLPAQQVPDPVPGPARRSAETMATAIPVRRPVQPLSKDTKPYQRQPAGVHDLHQPPRAADPPLIAPTRFHDAFGAADTGCTCRPPSGTAASSSARSVGAGLPGSRSRPTGRPRAPDAGSSCSRPAARPGRRGLHRRLQRDAADPVDAAAISGMVAKAAGRAVRPGPGRRRGVRPGRRFPAVPPLPGPGGLVAAPAGPAARPPEAPGRQSERCQPGRRRSPRFLPIREQLPSAA